MQAELGERQKFFGGGPIKPIRMAEIGRNEVRRV